MTQFDNMLSYIVLYWQVTYSFCLWIDTIFWLGSNWSIWWQAFIWLRNVSTIKFRKIHFFVNIQRLKHNFIISQLHTAVFGFIQCSFILYIFIPAMFEYTIFIESLHLVNICSIIKRKSSSSDETLCFIKPYQLIHNKSCFTLLWKLLFQAE